MQLKLCPFPYLLWYTDSLPETVGGRTMMFTVRLRPKYKDDEGILKHEETHVKQYWIMTLPLLALIGIGGFFYQIIWAVLSLCIIAQPIIYQISKSYRKWAEVKAYKEQLKYPPATGNREYYWFIYVVALAQHYKLGISVEEAKRQIS